MKKSLLFFILLGTLCAVLFGFTVRSAVLIFQSERELPRILTEEQAGHRLVLITQELETPFWDRVAAGAKQEAERTGASLEVWGSYGKDQEDFLKKLEVAIYSKVDGIIVQGLDTDGFKELTKVRAAFYGVPVITVGSDVPMEDSLRRTYVGSDQLEAGRLIAQQLIVDMGNSGTVVVLGDSNQEYYQKQRLAGVQQVLQHYPDIHLVYEETEERQERVLAVTQHVMNQLPDLDAFISLNANMTAAMIQEISRRSQVDAYYIYSFDDSPDSLPLLMAEKLDGMIEQAPEEMGRKSVQLMMKWISGDKMPLDSDGYFTDIRMLKRKDAVSND